MLELEFTTTGYIYMAIIIALAGVIGACLAIKKGRNPFFWGILCMIVPMALFAIGGMRAPGEPVPERFRPVTDEENAEGSQNSNSSDKTDQ